LDQNPATDLTSQKALGRELIQANRIKEALDLFTALLKSNPDDIETLLVLGDLYLAGGDESSALQLYARALKIDPTRDDIIQRIQLAAPARFAPAPVTEQIPTQPEAVARLLQNLSGRTNPVTDEENEQTSNLLQRIIQSDTPADIVAAHLEEIDALLPALVELNIRQAYADGRPDLAEALTGLQVNIDLQLSAHRQIQEATPVQTPARKTISQPNWRVLFLLPEPKKPSPRILALAQMLGSQGCQIGLDCDYRAHVNNKPDVVIVSHPHCDQRLMESMAFFNASHVPILLDIEQNFEDMPIDHPDYPQKGLGNPAAARAYLTSLLLANVITVPNLNLGQRLIGAGREVMVIPDGWNGQNRQWSKPSPRRSSINIGWISTSGEQEDLLTIRRIINRVVREFPLSQLVIAGDPNVYQLFENLPDGRKLFLPSVEHEDMPYLLSQIDILLVPLRNIPYHQTWPDRLLVEAGVRGIPWLASPVGTVREWKTGGLVAGSSDEWHTYLRQLVMDEDLRVSLGDMGRRHAAEREMSQLAKTWLETIQAVMEKPNYPNPGFSISVNQNEPVRVP